VAFEIENKVRLYYGLPSVEEANVNIQPEKKEEKPKKQSQKPASEEVEFDLDIEELSEI